MKMIVRRRFLRHQFRFLRRYRHSLNNHQKMLYALTAATLLAPTALMDPLGAFKRGRRRTHLSTTEVLDPVYTPTLPVAERYRHYFSPTWLTDSMGNLNPALAEDAMAKPDRRRDAETDAAPVVTRLAG